MEFASYEKRSGLNANWPHPHEGAAKKNVFGHCYLRKLVYYPTHWNITLCSLLQSVSRHLLWTASIRCISPPWCPQTGKREKTRTALWCEVGGWLASVIIPFNVGICSDVEPNFANRFRRCRNVCSHYSYPYPISDDNDYRQVTVGGGLIRISTFLPILASHLLQFHVRTKTPAIISQPMARHLLNPAAIIFHHQQNLKTRSWPQKNGLH